MLCAYCRAARGERNAHGNAMLGSLRSLTHCLRKSQRKMPPELSKILSGATRNPVKTNLEALMGAQMRPRAHERRSKDGQQTPKSAQELAKSASDSPKTGPGDAQTLPKTSPVSPTTRFWLDLRGLLVSKGSSSDFLRFRARCAMLAKCVPTH